MTTLKELTGWVVAAQGRKHPEYFVVAIADGQEALAVLTHHIDDPAVRLKLGSPLNAVQLAARGLKAGDLYQVGARRRLKLHAPRQQR